MDRPLVIAFHNLAPSEQMEAEIRRHVEKLDTRHSHLIGCRVSVERLHTQHRTGNVIDVHVVLSLPGGDLAVSREPHHAKDRFAHADAYLSSLAIRCIMSKMKAARARPPRKCVSPRPDLRIICRCRCGGCPTARRKPAAAGIDR
jgi:hypothetical protein